MRGLIAVAGFFFIIALIPHAGVKSTDFVLYSFSFFSNF